MAEIVVGLALGAIVVFSIIMIFTLVPSENEAMKCMFCDGTKKEQSFRR